MFIIKNKIISRILSLLIQYLQHTTAKFLDVVAKYILFFITLYFNRYVMSYKFCKILKTLISFSRFSQIILEFCVFFYVCLIKMIFIFLIFLTNIKNYLRIKMFVYKNNNKSDTLSAELNNFFKTFLNVYCGFF